MRSCERLAPLALLALLAAAGCQNGDDPTAPAEPAEQSTAMVHGAIGSDAVEFEFLSAGSPGDPGQRPGPFLIRGQNIAYDADLGALTVDLTVVNAGPHTYPEPITLTFVQLLPDGVTVLNADNDETGAGAAILCQFANDDALWTPDEESLPRTVQFGVAQGTAIAFVARIDIGLLPDGGAVGGLVWNDLNEDGVIDADEPGLPDVTVRLEAGPDLFWVATTDADGMYRFDGLAAGFYTVTRLPRPDLRPTTPPQMQVVLVEVEGEVADFLAANFGCRVVAPTEPPIAVGDCLDVKGAFAGDPDRLVGELFCLCREDDDDEDGGPFPPCWQRVCGPVTAIDLAERLLVVMGTEVHVPHGTHLHLDDIEIGDRVRADVNVFADGEELQLVACRLHREHGHFDRVRGAVEEVVADGDGQVIGVRVLGVSVDLADAQPCDD